MKNKLLLFFLLLKLSQKMNEKIKNEMYYSH